MQRALVELVRVAETRLPMIERELAEIRQVADRAAESIYNATLYDPDGAAAGDDA